MEASFCGKTDVLNELLSHGANVMIVDRVRGLLLNQHLYCDMIFELL